MIPKVLLAGAITLMDELYFKLAVWLNDKGKEFCNEQLKSLINFDVFFWIFRKLQATVEI